MSEYNSQSSSTSSSPFPSPLRSPRSSNRSAALDGAWWSEVGDGVYGSVPSSATSVSSWGSGSGSGLRLNTPGVHTSTLGKGPGQMRATSSSQNQNLVVKTVPKRPPHTPSRYVALSTQFVCVGILRIPMLARVSIADYRGNVVYDTFVRPSDRVEDYRFPITGILPEHLISNEAVDISAVRERAVTILKEKIVVGHSLWTHFSMIGVSHPAIDTRDVALFLPFHRAVSSFTVIPLKNLVSFFMRRKITRKYEHPLEDARAALDLFRSYEDNWEDEIRAGKWPCALPPSTFKDYFS